MACSRQRSPLSSLSCWLVVLCGLLLAGSASAQAEYAQWYFGFHAGLRFPGGAAAPLLVPSPQLNSLEACASVSDQRGNLLFYTDGIQAWNQLHQPLANGTALGGYAGGPGVSEYQPNSATQGAAIIAKPGSRTEYYLFTLDAAENDLRKGLSYSVVDMSRQAGLGEVTTKAVPLPIAIGEGRLAEKLVVVRHANQRDIWVLVHGWNNNLFYALLVTPTGITPTPVVSGGGLVQQGGASFRGYANWNAIGAMKVSPDGRRLALVQFRSAPVEVFDFNTGTGTVSNPQQLTSIYTYSNYGVEFSPNSQVLYVTSGQGLTQYDLRTGQATSLNRECSFGALQLGPDGKIYQVEYTDSHLLDVVQQPNQLGLGCAYLRGWVVLPPGVNNWLGLPTALVTPPSSSAPLVSFGVVGTQVCQGEASTFTAAIYPVLPTATIGWDFGEPVAGAANTATGPTAQHRYAQAGTYQVTMSVRTAAGQLFSYTQPVTIFADLVTQLRASTACAGQPVTLTVYPTPPIGTLYTWQDGLVDYSSMRTVQAAGVYWVDIQAPQRCPHRDSLRLTLAPAPTVSLGLDRPVDCNEPLLLDATTGIAGSSYRWQDGSTQAQYAVVQPGQYAVSVTTPIGCTVTSSVTIGPAACQVVLPTIITPNNDRLNDQLVVQGLVSGTFEVAVYNRWGRLVFQQASYHNTWDAGGQADGLYYYAVTTATGQRYKSWLEVRH
jgi:gliding motility-associated-like protein